MNYNIYFSPTGGTKKVADILAGNLGGGFARWIFVAILKI